MDEDATLVAGALAGHTRDFEMLVERHQRTVYALARRYLGDDVAADDVVQATFLQAYAHLARFRGDASFRTWLCGIAMNQARALARTRRRERAVPLDDVPEAELPVSDDETLPATGRALARLVAELPPRQRAVLSLRIGADLPFKEIALVEGISENAAKVNFHHAITRLRRLLGEDPR